MVDQLPLAVPAAPPPTVVKGFKGMVVSSPAHCAVAVSSTIARTEIRGTDRTASGNGGKFPLRMVTRLSSNGRPSAAGAVKQAPAYRRSSSTRTVVRASADSGPSARVVALAPSDGGEAGGGRICTCISRLVGAAPTHCAVVVGDTVIGSNGQRRNAWPPPVMVAPSTPASTLLRL